MLTFMKNVCIDTECTMSLIDRKWLLQQQSTIAIHTFVSLILIQEISDKIHSSFNYVELFLYIIDFNEQDSAIAQIDRVFHLVDELRVKMLVDMNIVESKDDIIDLSSRKFRLVCKISVDLNVTSTTSRVNRAIRLSSQITISSHNIMRVHVKLREKSALSTYCDYVF